MLTAFVILLVLVAVMTAVGWLFVWLGSAFTSFNPRLRYILYPVAKRSE